MSKNNFKMSKNVIKNIEKIFQKSVAKYFT